MFLQFALLACLVWIIITIWKCQDSTLSAKLSKEGDIVDIGGGIVQGILIVLPLLWLTIKIQSLIAVAGIILFAVIVVNLAIGGYLVSIWLDVATAEKKRGEIQSRQRFVRDGFVALIFLAAAVYWLMAVLFPGVLTPADAYQLQYTTEELFLGLFKFICGIIILGFFVWLFLGSLSDW